jgi:hypothetical protein
VDKQRSLLRDDRTWTVAKVTRSEAEERDFERTSPR